MKLNGYLCFEYQYALSYYAIILILDIYTNILPIDIHDLDIYKI